MRRHKTTNDQNKNRIRIKLNLGSRIYEKVIEFMLYSYMVCFSSCQTKNLKNNKIKYKEGFFILLNNANSSQHLTIENTQKLICIYLHVILIYRSFSLFEAHWSMDIQCMYVYVHIHI